MLYPDIVLDTVLKGFAKMMREKRFRYEQKLTKPYAHTTRRFLFIDIRCSQHRIVAAGILPNNFEFSLDCMLIQPSQKSWFLNKIPKPSFVVKPLRTVSESRHYLYSFRGEPAITEFDWPFTPRHKSFPDVAISVDSALQ